MRLGLVLAGGGSKGAFEAGVVAAMERRGLVADVLSGTSAGALNAAGLAAGFDAARLGDIWRQVGSADVTGCAATCGTCHARGVWRHAAASRTACCPASVGRIC